MISADFKNVIREIADNGLLGGVYRATPTGEILSEEDGTYIEVMVMGKSVFAKPCMAFGEVNVPNKAWLEKYKNEILVWVAFEYGNPAHPVYLGVCTLDGKAIGGEDYPNVRSWKSVEYTYEFNDTKKTYRLEHIETGAHYSIDGTTGEIELKSGNGQGFKTNGSTTILGSGEGAKSVAIGEEVIARFNDLMNALTAGTLVDINTGVIMPTVVTALQGVSQALQTINSKEIKLDT